jgi:adenosylcobinamide-phosphate synthase
VAVLGEVSGLVGHALGALVPAAALALDRALGDPPNRWHPVAWFGAAVERAMRWAPARPRAQVLFGGSSVVAAVLLVFAASWLAMEAARAWSDLLAMLLGALLLNIALAYRGLRQEALRVAAAVDAADVEGAARHLRALVSRNPLALSPALACSAAVESLAENLSDSLVAPLCYFLLFGVPGALAYRAVNTLDAMVGYHGRYEYLGKAAAHLDDLANWLPARLTALLIIAAAKLAPGDWRSAATIAWAHQARTESPNAGWPMAAMAGALGVRLEKVGHYRLGEGREPAPADVALAVRISDRAWLLTVVLTVLVAAW